MLNLKHHSDSASNFLDAVIKSKRNTTKDPTFQARLMLLESELKKHFTDYDDAFTADCLQMLTANGYSGQEKDDILALYSYKSAIIQKLKAGVTTVALKRVLNTCQNCTIGEINSFDHVVPQNEFPEFVVHPKNLFPSCTRCNGHKSKIWRESGNRLFLNLYMDLLPEEQYLFVTANILKSDIDISFSISNKNGINNSLFSKIKYHYKKLYLCERFTENVDKVVTPLRHSLSSSLNKLSIVEAVEVAKDTAKRNRRAFGFNYWKSLLELELLSSPSFLRICESEK